MWIETLFRCRVLCAVGSGSQRNIFAGRRRNQRCVLYDGEYIPKE